MFGRDQSAAINTTGGNPVVKNKDEKNSEKKEGDGLEEEAKQEVITMDEEEKKVSETNNRPFWEKVLGNLPILFVRMFLVVMAVVVYVFVTNNLLPILWNERFQPMAAKSATWGFMFLFWSIVGPFVAAKIVAKQYDSIETYLALLLGNFLDAIIPGKQDNLGKTIDRLHDASVGHLMHLFFWGLFSIFPGSVLVLLGMINLYYAFTYIS